MATNVQTQDPATLTAATARPADNPPCGRCHGTRSVTHFHGYSPDADDCPQCGGEGRMSNREAWRLWLDQAIAAGDHSRAYDMVDALIGAETGHTVMSCDAGTIRVITLGGAA